MKLRKGRLIVLAAIAGLAYLFSRELAKAQGAAQSNLIPTDEIEVIDEDELISSIDVSDVNIKTAKLDI